MKTVKRGDVVRRVEDGQAHMMVNNGWEYCSKELWKENRPKKVSKNNKSVIEDTVSDNLSDKKKRKARKELKKKKYEDR
tara:strand:+ start:16158 stop:16394 length:237 start_codon:yes stop_codon:yes gene_type:complete